uniref:Uncharacterized protein n=1 Tax=Arundo donax TaxID=35708 RepID=A0A0A9G6W2_ARUDO
MIFVCGSQLGESCT